MADVTPPETTFARDTRVEPLGENAFRADIAPEWRAGRGPHGGYLAAIILRALGQAVDDDARVPRSLTVHYTRAPEPGPVLVHAAVQRRGRSVSTVSARLEQDGRLMALALAAFSVAWPGPSFDELPPPQVQPPDPRPNEPTPAVEGLPRFLTHMVLQPRLGPWPFSGAQAPMETGGWLGLYEPQPIDAHVAALLCDAWWSPPFVRLDAPATSPTIDLTIHFRRRLPLERADPAALSLARFRTRVVHDGFFENDAVIWSPEGTVLAQARQLALLLPVAAGFTAR